MSGTFVRKGLNICSWNYIIGLRTSVFAFDSIIGNIGVLICDIISFVAFEIYTFGDLGWPRYYWHFRQVFQPFSGIDNIIYDLLGITCKHASISWHGSLQEK